MRFRRLTCERTIAPVLSLVAVATTTGPASGLYPDTRRLITAIVASEADPVDVTRVRYKVKSVGRSGYRWTTDLPDVVKRAYQEAIREESET